MHTHTQKNRSTLFKGQSFPVIECIVRQNEAIYGLVLPLRVLRKFQLKEVITFPSNCHIDADRKKKEKKIEKRKGRTSNRSFAYLQTNTARAKEKQNRKVIICIDTLIMAVRCKNVKNVRPEHFSIQQGKVVRRTKQKTRCDYIIAFEGVPD